MTAVDSQERIAAEYREMPGLRLTTDQAQRLCGLELAECRTSLQHLVQAGYLRESSRGQYALATSQV